MTIMMNKHLAILALAALVATGGISLSALAQPGPPPIRFRSDQDAARHAMLEGNVMPLSVLRRRVDAEVEARYGEEAEFLTSEFMPERNRYRMKYMHDRKVIWVDVDGRTGAVIAFTGR